MARTAVKKETARQALELRASVQKEENQRRKDVEALRQLRVKEDAATFHWEMGDLVLRLQRSYKKELLEEMCGEAGVTYSQARQRAWVAKAFPSESDTGREVRNLCLPYSSLRTIAGIKEEDKRLVWAKKAHLRCWEPKDLKKELQDAGVIAAPREKPVELFQEPCCNPECERQFITEAGREHALELRNKFGSRWACDLYCLVRFLGVALADTGYPAEEIERMVSVLT